MHTDNTQPSFTPAQITTSTTEETKQSLSNKITECTPCASDLRSYEIDYDEVSESESYRMSRTSKGNEISPSKLPLMRIRSVEIVFEDELSACTEAITGGPSFELVLSDSDDSTKCMDDDLDHAQLERDDNEEVDSVTLNAELELSDENSESLKDDLDHDTSRSDTNHLSSQDLINDSTTIQTDSLMLITDDISLSLNVSDIGDSGRFTEEASSSHFEKAPLASYDDALLSHSLDVIKTQDPIITIEVNNDSSHSNVSEKRLLENVNSNSDSSENTALFEAEVVKYNDNFVHLNTVQSDEQSVCDSSDLQYDSFVDMGKF